MPLKKIEGSKITSGDRENGDYRFYTSAVSIFISRWELSTLSGIVKMPDLSFVSESGTEMTVPKEIAKNGEEAILNWLEEQDEFDDSEFWELSIPGGETLKYRWGQKRK